MNEVKYIKVQCRDGTVVECRIAISQSPPWKLVFSGLTLESREFSGSDLFEAFIALRQELNRFGAQPLCAGARRDVFPSAMSRNMGGGRKAYVTRLGTPARQNSLVDIFDDAAPEMVSSVAEQNAFHEEWFRSLGSGGVDADQSGANSGNR